MSRSLWAVFLAAIFGITSWLDKSNPSGFVTSPTLGVSEKRTASQFLWRSAGTEYSALGNFPPNVGGTGATKSPPKGLLQSVTAATSGTISVKLQDIPVGKVIQIGVATNGLKFVKIGDNQYISIVPACDDGLAINGIKNFDYTGGVQAFQVCAGHTYKLEVWGAQGGKEKRNNNVGGYGGYSVGTLASSANTSLYIYVGQQGTTDTTNQSYNGGGGNLKASEGTGGGASDIAIKNSAWNSSDHYYSRIIVAGGGGGRGCDNGGTFGILYGGGADGGDGGGWYSSSYGGGYGGTQIAGGNVRVTNPSNSYPGEFGTGGTGYGACGGGGGGGWYGGGGGMGKGGGGGSGWIYTESTYTYWKNNSTDGKSGNWLLDSTYYLTNASIVAGNASMPNPRGSGNITGNSGHGYARITRLN